MRRRLAYPLLGGALAAALAVPLTAPAAADPEPRRKPPAVRDFGNGPERNTVAGSALKRRQGADLSRFPWQLERGYPRRTTLAEPAENTSDAAIKLGLTPYHAIAPKLNELQKRSDRISVEVIGRSHQGRELYLVTVTEPESSVQAKAQAAMRTQIENDPAKAARNPLIKRSYKAPVFINNNIHGNEWEGTDAALRTIERLATAKDAQTKRLLAKSRLYFNVTANPDGRVNNTRANGAGFDMNRDFITGSQPEVRSMRQVMIDTQPVVMLDLHGYVNGTLVEPTTPPHGQNYEYDLFIKNAYANGLGMEAAIKALGYTPEADGVNPPQIPFRDWDEGWDDWPPIFTPQYAPFHGAVASHTIEIPLRVNNADYTSQPVDELRRRSKINTDIAAAAMDGALSFVQQRGEQLVADQIEMFRRGAAGEASKEVPLGIVPGFGPEDVYNTTFPRAYVIPSGQGQRSAPAAARLVDHLIANDVRVQRSTKAFTLGGKSYPAGSYVVDMHQPKRGMANVLLEAGADISPRVDAMYDISGWSLSHLWGATVDPVRSGDLRGVKATQVSAAAPSGSVAPSGDLGLRLDDPKEVSALNDLLGQGVKAQWTADGGVVIPASARSAARTVADRYGVQFTKAAGKGVAPLRKLNVAAAGSADDVYTLQEMGFTVTPVSTATLNAGFDWSGVDVLYVSSGLNYAQLNEAARTALNGFLARGGVVTRGSTGATFNSAAGLLTATAVAGRSDANGTVSVANAGGPITSGSAPYSFVYSPRWFTGLGPEVTVEQRFDGQAPLIAGHWRANANGTGGPNAAAGQAAVVRGVDERGAAVVLFGTEPMFRNHPKGLFPQVARSLYWTSVTAGQDG
ncbi:Zinc carboxypeptidase [Thermomonospora echinospora]|uniref:Zinc carboxypeptidase n=1 Tax=Thermomonospora echinospora TaxID=1992 RepID=A0A1H6D4C3_9ACTN|nr:M14 family zinc carboxypeptidase [Thermomonospora echinospora]SEG80150.1 Zinc carboxypeptidase [Thermomonospora echinospora]